MCTSHGAPDAAMPCWRKSPSLLGFHKQLFGSQQSEVLFAFLGTLNSKRSWSKMRRISLLERRMVLSGPLLQRGPVSIWKQRCTWVYFQMRLLPQILLATTPRRAGFVCGQGLKNHLNWRCREDKISACSPWKFSVTRIQLLKHKTNG